MSPAVGGPTPGQRFINGILPENPIYRQLLGLCPTLAVTAALAPALTMGVCVLFVLFCANTVTSLIRHMVKPHLRILVFTGIIAAFVTLVDRVLAAYVPEMSSTLGPYVPLIIVNCLVLSRCEVVASKNGLIASMSDAVGQSVGFGLGLLSIAVFRELLGAGTLFGAAVMPEAFPTWGVMLLPPGAFITLGLLIGAVNWYAQAQANRKARAADDSKAQLEAKV